MSLEGKKVILAVCGSIAAYKSLILLRLLVKLGAEVKVILTQDAQKFVGKLSFSSLTSHEVLTDLSSDDEWKNHVELGLWADLMMIAPATANTIAKCAHGITDNLLQAVYLSARCPIMIAPAMDLDMWAHSITQSNVQKLRSIGVDFVPVGTGLLASGLSGEGRLAEPEVILEYIQTKLSRALDLKGKTILVTAGPTHEAIDPVRFISNHSSGKMGLRIAEAAAQRGARVDMVLGPVHEEFTQYESLRVYKIISAQEMMNKVKELEKEADYFILAAAVADFMPENEAVEKIKKSQAALTIQLRPTPDIAAFLGENKRKDQKLVGFALETTQVRFHGEQKLHKKNMDMIVMNSPRVKGAAFGNDTNKIEVLKKSGEYISFELKSKRELAHDILDEMIKL